MTREQFEALRKKQLWELSLKYADLQDQADYWQSLTYEDWRKENDNG